MSQASGERVLCPEVRDTAADHLVVAPGFSCRYQIADFCGNRRGLHTAELLAIAGEGENVRTPASCAPFDSPSS